MNTEIVIALYKAKPGKESELETLIEQHVPVLRELALITSRPRLTMKSIDGTYLEVFEWTSSEASKKAHDQPAVAKIWAGMEAVSEFRKLNELNEAAAPFSHFKVVSHLSDTFK